MDEENSRRFFELADLIHGVGRQLRPPADLEPGLCTPIEITVMRFIRGSPGTSASAASAATLLPTSNFSRVLKSLERKGLVRREADGRDARGVMLFLTPLAEDNFRRMREAWCLALQGTVDDPGTIDILNAALRRIEAGLVARQGASEG